MDASPTGVVFDVQRSCWHDGPGIRTTVFLKGCPLRCAWCHNPEGIDFAPQVLVSPRRCANCGACGRACPREGGPLAPGARLGTDACTSCGACVDACPAGARRFAGTSRGVAGLVAEVLRDHDAFEESGGGVTFSGGEPAAQAEFVCACLDALRRAEVSTAVETCGCAPRAAILAIARRADLLLWDVKHLDPARHRELTGAPLEPILDNLRAVDALGVGLWLRIPVLPGINDDEPTLNAISRLAASLRSVRGVSLLPYHRTGLGKLARLGRETTAEAIATPTAERMREIAFLFAGCGKEITIGE